MSSLFWSLGASALLLVVDLTLTFFLLLGSGCQVLGHMFKLEVSVI